MEYKIGNNKQHDSLLFECIMLALTDVNEQRFTDFNTSLKECLEFLTAVDKKLNEPVVSLDGDFEKEVFSIVGSILRGENLYTPDTVRSISERIVELARKEAAETI